jgi:hypothetical protein
MTTPESFERDQQALDPHRKEEFDAVTVELRSRAAQKGVDLDGTEGAEDLDDLLTAVDRFEAAVEAKGGDLMVNMPESSPPENPGFVLPRRRAGEHIATFNERVQAAAEAVERGQR